MYSKTKPGIFSYIVRFLLGNETEKNIFPYSFWDVFVNGRVFFLLSLPIYFLRRSSSFGTPGHHSSY